jgi:hypothetical protein
MEAFPRGKAQSCLQAGSSVVRVLDTLSQFVQGGAMLKLEQGPKMTGLLTHRAGASSGLIDLRVKYTTSSE